MDTTQTTSTDTLNVQFDPRPPLDLTLALAGRTMRSVEPAQLDLATPCEDWTVRDLLGHFVGIARRITALGRGEPALNVPSTVTDVDDGDYATAFDAAAADVRQVWSDDELLGRIVSPPFGDLPGAMALGIYISELNVHTWDLASSTGQQPAFDDDIVGACLAGIRGALPPEGRPADVPFADAVPVPDNAPLIHQLVAYCGRRP